MKKLRKILVALALVALLVSSVVVIVVTAEDTPNYTGTLDEAQEKLNDALEEMASSESTTDLRKGKIALVYNYLRANPVDPETEGYDEFERVLYETSLKIANDYYTKKLLTATSDSAKKKQLGVVLNYFAAFPIPAGTPDPDPEGDLYLSYDDLLLAVNTFNFNMANGYYTTAKSKINAATPDINAAMQSLKSLYVHVESYPIAESLPQAEQFYADYNLFALQLSESVISEMQALKESADSGDSSAIAEYKSYMSSKLSVLREHIKACPIDLETFPELEERYNAISPAISVAELDQIIFLFEDFKNFVPDSTMLYPDLAEAAALAKVSKALSDSTIPEETEGYAELVASIAEEEERLAAVKENRRLALANEAKLYEYDLLNNMSYKTFSADTETMGNPNADAGEYSERVKTYDNGLSSGYEAYWRYVVLGNPQSNYSYASLTQHNITNGFVVSFDFMAEGTNGTHYDKATFTNEWDDAKGNRLVNYGSLIFGIAYDSATDSLKVYNQKKTGVGDGGVVPVSSVTNIAAEGQWFNVMLVYDPITHIVKLYIDYEYMFDCYMEGWVEGATRTMYRISHQSAWQNSCYDNIRFYEGTAYRDVNMFDTMSDSELYTFYVNYFLNDANDSKSRNYAYVNAELLMDGIKSQYESLPENEMTDELKELRTLVEKMEAFNYNENIANEVKAANLAEILKQVDALEKIEAYSTNVKAINQAISNLDQFIAENNDFIDKSNPTYNEAVMRVNDVKANLVRCENAVAFARALTLFERATSVASMTRRATTLDEIYKAARYDKAENVEYVKDDPAFATFEAIINPAGMLNTDSAYVDAFEYYKTIPAIIAEQVKVENSVRIIKCIELLLQMEGYQNTEEFWLANYDDVEFFVSIIRDIVSAENYDPTYPGIDAAMEQYELIDAYFYVLLQQEHIAIIGAQLDRFAASTSYIEKIGICTYVERYFASNGDIDLTLPEIQDFLYRLERYNAELVTYMDDYKELLERNTRYFIDTVQKMEILTTYAELKPLYEQALEYYYAMNAITDEAKAAVAIFDDFDKALISIQTNSELFLKASQNLDLIDLLDVGERYLMLSECALYYDYLDATYSDTIAKRMALYEKLVSEYDAEVDIANEVVETANVISSALRADEIPVPVLAVISQLYKNN